MQDQDCEDQTIEYILVYVSLIDCIMIVLFCVAKHQEMKLNVAYPESCREIPVIELSIIEIAVGTSALTELKLLIDLSSASILG